MSERGPATGRGRKTETEMRKIDYHRRSKERTIDYHKCSKERAIETER